MVLNTEQQDYPGHSSRYVFVVMKVSIFPEAVMRLSVIFDAILFQNLFSLGTNLNRHKPKPLLMSRYVVHPNKLCVVN